MMRVSCCGKQIQGAREYQEDSFLVEKGTLPDNARLLIVCDGMGGHEGGDIASRTVSEVIAQSFLEEDDKSPAQKFKSGLDKANAALAEMVQKGEAPDGLGTTIVAVFVDGQDLHWLSVGDSLLYHIRKGQIEQLNEDHSMAPILDQMADAGRITKEEARSDPQRNALRSAVMGAKIELVNIQSKENYLQKGDALILASDGLLSIPESEIAESVEKNIKKGPEPVANDLLNSVAARDLPHQDNTTVIAFIINRGFSFWPFS